MTKVTEKLHAIHLRKQGHSLNRIRQLVKVSKGTLSVWLVDIPYKPNRETIIRVGNARAASGYAKSRQKRESFEKARREALDGVGKMSQRDVFMLGLGLYIGEGAKSVMETRFVNSSPVIIRLIIRWLNECLGLKKEHVRIRLHIYPDSDERKCLQFWAEEISIPQGQFFKSMIDKRVDKRVKKVGKLPYGTAHLTVNSLGDKRFGVFLARKILAMSELVLRNSEARD